MAFESARFSIGWRTELDSRLMIRPRPLLRRCGRQRFVRRIAEKRRSSSASLSASSSSPAAGPAGGPPPLFTRMSSPPKVSTVRRTRRLRSRGFVRSPWTASAPIRSASRSSTERRRANMTTFAPALSSASAIARPIPDDAPQTIAVLSFRLIRTALRLRGEERHRRNDDVQRDEREALEHRGLAVAGDLPDGDRGEDERPDEDGRHCVRERGREEERDEHEQWEEERRDLRDRVLHDGDGEVGLPLRRKDDPCHV